MDDPLPQLGDQHGMGVSTKAPNSLTKSCPQDTTIDLLLVRDSNDAEGEL